GGPERGLDAIQGQINLTSSVGLYVTVDDSGTKTAQSFTITQDRLKRSGAADITFGKAADFPLYVYGGSGGDRFDIQGKPGNLTVDAGGGDDVMSIGRANRT